MIDWFTGVVSYDASGLRPDFIYRVDRDGNVLWETECWVEAEGSYCDKMRLRRKAIDQQLRLWIPDDQAEELLHQDFLQISGNPSKFLQGHNAFGPSVSLLEPVVKAAIIALPDSVRPLGVSDPVSRKYKSSRVDIAVMINMSSHEDVHAWLNAIAGASRSRHGRALVSGDTVYWGKHSRRWTLKAYCKYCEMAEHGMADKAINSMVRQFAKGQLRLELTLRTPELKNKTSLDETLLWKYFDRLEMGVLEMDRLNEIEALPLSTQGVVMKWLNGFDIRMKMSRPTFYRHRRLILDCLDVDISIPKRYQAELGKRITFDGDYLKQREVTQIPELLQGLLFKPEHGMAFSVS